MKQQLLTVENISVSFKRSGGNVLPVLSDVSVYVSGREVLGIVGESGCGKTTLARVIMQLIEPQQGAVILEGVNLTALSGSKRGSLRSHMQMIFQDPYASLNPRMTVLDILAEPLRYHRNLKGPENLTEVLHLMEQVGIPTGYLRKYPHEFSGGQRQRIAIARALAVRPSLIIADEPVSALDVSVQAQILNLLADLRRTMDVSMLFISHDLSVVRFIAHRIAVMFKGRIVECGPAEAVFANPGHPYTQALIAAVPVPDPDYAYKDYVDDILVHAIQNPDGPNIGCPYSGRCSQVQQQCLSAIPALEPFGVQDHTVACVRKHELIRSMGTTDA
jgi:oligopeptide/dipeptide ABC transporter ATP-binding protein